MATISKTMIFNMALNELGVSAPIANANAQDDTRAIILRNFYETARDEVLKSFDWNFAETFRQLTPTVYECLHPSYDFVYDYPNDCLSAREVFQECATDVRRKFKVSSDSTGQKVLLTTVQPIILRYTRRVEQEAFFTPEFAVTLSLYLAALAGRAITGSAEKSNDAMKRYWDRLRFAQMSNAAEGQEVDEDKNTYLDVR